MKKIFLIFIIFTSIIFSNQAHFLTHPSLSPNADKVYFAFDGDIWMYDFNNSTTARITAMDGIESNPVVSPDGKWLAFSGRQEDNSNVYLVPVNGGEIKQLTFYDRSDLVESWSWDSKYIYFTSSRYNQMTTFKISINGGTPERLFEGFFTWPHNLVEHPSSGELFFNETWESQGYASRKRYKGDFNPDIKSFNTKTNEFKVYTEYDGKDLWPTIDKNGNIFFASDENNGEYNLYTFENGQKKVLTEFDTSIGRPRVSADGSKVVFEKDYQLFVFNTTNNKVERLAIPIPINKTLTLKQSFNVGGEITAFDVSPDGKKITFISRGELFVSDADGKFIKQLSINNTERATDVYWLKDNKTLLYTRTVKGWENIFTITADGSGNEKQITSGKMNIRAINFNNDRTIAVYHQGRENLCLLDLNNFEPKTIVKDEFWALYPTTPQISPDSKYIAYVAMRNFEEEIFVYDIENEKAVNFTHTGVSENNPYWSPDGKYLYFESDRINPSYPRGTKDSEIFRVALRKFDSEFKSDEFGKLFTEEKKDTSKPEVEIDFNNLTERWEKVVDHPLNQSNPYVIKDGNKTHLLYSSNHDNTGTAIWMKTFEPFESVKTNKISGSESGSLEIVSSKNNHYTIIKGNIHKLNLSQNKTDKISINFQFEKNMRNEFEQMFYETFANVDENFYDGKFHGENFNKIKDRYSKYLDYLNSRDDLRRLLRDLLGELNSSHQNFYSTGKEEKTFFNSVTAATGIIFNNKKPFEFEKIITKSSADNINVNLKPGDKLVAVNDVNVDEKINREKYFNFASMPEELKLTFERAGQKFDIKIHPESTGSLYDKIYDEWVAENQSTVDEKSDKKIAYIHMKNMVGPELNNFLIEVANELHYRDGLILDLRHNRGGNVHDAVLQMLSQRPYTKWKYRDGKYTLQPNFVPSSKPIVLLINEQSLSDAEMTAAGFKELKLGTIIGTETYRWLIFTSGRGLVDGSFYRLPSWGCYFLDGTNIETDGVKPDIYIKKTFKDKVNNVDPQLDAAIKEILNKF